MTTAPPTPDDLLKLDNQLCFALVTAARNVVGLYRPILEPLGLTHPQYLVMLALWERSPRSLRELAGELALEPAHAASARPPKEQDRQKCCNEQPDDHRDGK